VLNQFCLNKRILQRNIEFFVNDSIPYWCIFLEYEIVLEKNDAETKGLTEAGKLCYDKLRAWRRETADKDGVPPFVIAKNSHLVEIINKKVATLEALKQINGFGDKKVEKYGKEITGIIRTFFETKNDIKNGAKN